MLHLLGTLLALLAAVPVTAPATNPAVDSNLLPRYGDAGKATIWSTTAAAGRPKLRRFSDDAAGKGWDYLQRGDPETAMKRFNQAWLLCPENAGATWGMAIVEFERAKRLAPNRATADALALLDQAVALADDAAALPSPPAPLLHDAAMLRVTRADVRRELKVPGAASDLDDADALLRRAEALDPNPMIYDTWATLERARGHADRAAAYDRKATAMRAGRKAGE